MNIISDKKVSIFVMKHKYITRHDIKLDEVFNSNVLYAKMEKEDSMSQIRI